MVLIFDLAVFSMQPDEFLQVYFDPARVGPVLGVQLAGLEDDREAQLGAGIDDFGCERVGHGQLLGHAAAFGARAGRVEVAGVQALEGLVGGVVGGGLHFGVAGGLLVSWWLLSLLGV